MRCTDPRTVGFRSDGKTISWSPKHYSKEFATFQLPCGQCIACRLDYARQWAIRCVHESKMYDENSFITLTYSDENLKTPQLEYRDFQLFVKKLRKTYANKKIGLFVTGEYGETRKRKHWHAIIFNWRPTDCIYKYSNDRGDKVYSSKTLDRIWGHGITEIGSVTFESAGYCARYAAKKLVHGKDQNHDFQPISKKSSKHAIGKTFLEKFYKDIFNHGYIILPNGEQSSIPRYYEKWFKKHKPTEWEHYVTQTKQNKITRATDKARNDKAVMDSENDSRSRRSPGRYTAQITANKAKEKIQQSRFKLLQSKLKL